MKKTRILMIVHLAFWLTVGFTVRAAAYLDISSFSTGFVAIAGAVVACSAAFFIVWRKLKSGVSKTLGIDENAKKEVEEDLVIKEDEDEK